MMRSKIVTALIVLTIGLSAAPAGATHTDVAPVDRAPVPVLAGKNTIFGSESSWARVRLPAEVDISGIYDMDTKVEGNGRILALFLLREVDGEIPARPSGISLMRFGNCDTRACEPSPFTNPWMSSSTLRLSKGLYRVYLVIDGAPASVSFELPGLPGATRIHPTRDARAKVHTMTPRLHESVTGVVFSAGDKAPFGGRGISMQGQYIDPIGAGTIHNGYCVYKDRAPSDQLTAYLPTTCDDRPSMSPTGVRPVTPLNDQCCWGFQMAMDYLPKAMGNWYTSVGAVEDSGAVALWLQLN